MFIHSRGWPNFHPPSWINLCMTPQRPAVDAQEWQGYHLRNCPCAVWVPYQVILLPDLLKFEAQKLVPMNGLLPLPYCIMIGISPPFFSSLSHPYLIPITGIIKHILHFTQSAHHVLNLSKQPDRSNSSSQQAHI